MKRWIAIALLTAAWCVSGTAAVRFHERAEAAEARAVAAEAWAEAVEEEAAMILAETARPAAK